MNTRFAPVFAALFALSLVACGDTTSDGPTNAPPETLDFAKSDISNGVTRVGAMTFGEAVSGAFTEDFEMHAYTIRAKKDAELTVKLLASGTDIGLNTKLYLYAPTDDRGYVRIAKDQFGGRSDLSRIDITLKKDGDFLAVLTTEDGDGRGDYRMALLCAHDDCALEPAEPEAFCPDRLDELLVECIENADPDALRTEPGLSDFDVVANHCIARDEALMYHEQLCQLGDDEWCFEDFETFFRGAMIPACGAIQQD